jgi:hypothetical protein
MNDYDFKECKFIDEELRFLTFQDFFYNREIIRLSFNNMTREGKIFYKWFIYANIHMKEKHKNAIWDYLNFYDPDGIGLLKFAHFSR